MKDKIKELIDLYNRRLVESARGKYYDEVSHLREEGANGCLEDVIADLKKILEEEK